MQCSCRAALVFVEAVGNTAYLYPEDSPNCDSLAVTLRLSTVLLAATEVSVDQNTGGQLEGLDLERAVADVTLIPHGREVPSRSCIGWL
jgi:hypothetical protein